RAARALSVLPSPHRHGSGLPAEWLSGGGVRNAASPLRLGISSRRPRPVCQLWGCGSRTAGAARTVHQPRLLVLPADMWDYLGWKDTLALTGHTLRQRAYARLRGDRQVYTPQMVVNGVTHVVGSDRAAIENAIAQTDRDTTVMSVPVLLSAAGNDFSVTLKPAPAALAEPVDAEVWLCPLSSAIAVPIGRGENGGRTITYRNVVRGWHKLGAYSGTEATWSVPVSQI